MTPKIPRGLERYPLGTKLDGADERWDATDRDRGRDVTVTRVAFGPGEREARDALVERVRALYVVASPALIAALDAGPWDDDAFVVEERVIEPQSLDAAPLDPREKALAARSIAEGVAALHEAGWALSSLDVVVDAYRQPKIAIARATERATDQARVRDLERLAPLVATLAPGTPKATSASALAAAVVVPDAGPSRPLVHASAPKGSPLLWLLVLLAVLAVAVVAVTLR